MVAFMEYRFFLFLAPFSLALLLVTMGAVLRFRREPLARILLVYFSFVLLLIAANILELFSPSRGGMLFWTKIQHFAFSFLAFSWFIFAWSYSGSRRKPFPSRLLGFALIVPVLTTILVFTTPLHHLFYRSFTFAESGGLSTLRPRYGVWFWVYGVYSYLLILGGAFLLLRTTRLSASLYRKQGFWVVGGCLMPLLVNIVYLLPLPSFSDKDFTPLAFAFSGTFFFIGIYWYRLLQVLPIARDAVFQCIDLAVVIFNKKGNLVDYNGNAEKLFSLKESHLGRHYSELGKLNLVIRHKTLGVGETFEAEWIDSQQYNRNLDISLRPLTDRKSASPLGMILIASDVSTRVRLMESRLKLLADLERSHRDLDEARARMVHQEKLASLGQMAAGMAHELKNPAGFLESNLRVLKRETENLAAESRLDPKEVQHMMSILDDTSEGVQRIVQVVDNLMQFSRAGNARNPERYDLSEGWKKTLGLVRFSIPSTVKLELDWGEVPLINCYAGEINQVLLNLLKNALEAVEACVDEPGYISIAVTTGSDGWAVTEITNNGPPLSSEEEKRLFEPFFTTKKGPGGTGLGLSIAWDIVVQRHKGRLTHNSSLNRTTFRMELPLNDD